jgi:hypothetical protein
MKRTKRGIEVKNISGNKSVMYKAFDLLLEEGVKRTEGFLVGKGLMNSNEKLYSVNQMIEYDENFVSFDVTPISFGVVKI